MTKISIIIPTFKEANYISQTLNSIEKLKGNIEVILVETVSDETEALENVVSKFERVRLYKIKKRGIAKARNHGALKAKGNLLLFLDADVFVTKDVVKQVHHVFKNPFVIGATCNNYPVKPKLGELLFFKFYNTLIRLVLSLPPVKLKHSRGEFIAVRRASFEEIGGFNEDLVCMEDADLAHRLSILGKFVFIKDLTVYESMRRIRRLGLFRTFMMWFRNWLFYIIRSDVVAKEWKPVR
ncbi:MAG: glycosyltransferase [Candidatus Bathyarchaeota archaeon]|jgi:glycosyltransferase involved in cell wall biosynthesis